ncbi:MAG: hypothetical protein MUC43_04065 [Pirellula sp.]|nr:hypothetical protein [Pirellula sp.]
MELFVSASGVELSPQTIRALSQGIDLAVDRLETVIESINVQIKCCTKSRSEAATVLNQSAGLSCQIQVSLSENEPIELSLERITERLGVVISKRADDRKLAALSRKNRSLHSQTTSSISDITALI